MNPGFEVMDTFFLDFAVSCVKPDGSVVKVLLDMVDQELLGAMVVASEIKMTGKTSDLDSLVEFNRITVDGTDYDVRKLMKIGDGLLMEVHLSRVS
jgi:hypothetical protein